VPRYGVEDVARALTLIDGRGRQLSAQELGALKLFDILLKR